jgi:hypothetical protein
LEGTADAQAPDHDALLANPPWTTCSTMVHNCTLYVSAVRQAQYAGSRWIVRSKLPDSGQTDSRPILFRAVDRWPGVHAVLGGELDNVYDMEPFLAGALKETFGA